MEIPLTSLPIDIPAHCYQLSFEANPAWTTYYAKGSEILEYWKRVADKYDVRKYLKLSHEATEARWDREISKWRVKLEDLQSREKFEDIADVLIGGIGLLNKWKWPEVPGLQTFKGRLLHNAAWDDSFSYKDKRVAVIGSGSSGIQVVPALQPHVAKLDHYIRGRTWIATSFANAELKKRTDSASNFAFTAEEIDSWRCSPKMYLSFRKSLEAELQSGHDIVERNSAAQRKARETFTELMKSRLAKKPEMADHLVPSFPPLCRRLTPGPGYLESLTEPNVEVIPSRISEVNETGIVTEDGLHRPVDAIVCATGFDTSFRNRFPIYGFDGQSLQDRWSDKTSTYLSLAVDGFPNYFMSLGPNSALGSGNLLILMERLANYIAKLCSKIQTHNISSLQPSSSAVRNFTEFCDKYFAKTVFSEECNSWYKIGRNGRVAAVWPGSSLHSIRALDEVRWEDFEYTYVNDDPWGWFGNGWSERDSGNQDEKTYYLDEQTMLEDDVDGEDHGYEEPLKRKRRKINGTPTLPKPRLRRYL
ncbi:MAG: hypothetical protein Q9190_004920 [Brigantiaea leucoxantha]